MIAALILSAAAATASSPGTDVAVEFAAIAAAHRELSAFSVSIAIEFEPVRPGAPAIGQVMRRADGRELRRFADLLVLETPELRLAVDAGDRQIVIGEPRTPIAANEQLTSPAEAVAAWEASGARVVGGETTEDGRRWTLEPADTALPRTTLYVDPVSRRIQKLTYEVDDAAGSSARVTVRYTWGAPPAADATDFEVSQYVVNVRGEWRAAAGYADYRIVKTGPQH